MRLPPCAALVFLAMSACSALVPSTAARLSALDPLTADPAGIELVVILPPGLAIRPGSARLELSATRGTQQENASFILAEQPLVAEIAVPEGSTARSFAVASNDVARLRALQTTIAGWDRDGTARGALRLGIGGCAAGAGPAPDATATVLIRTSDKGLLMPLIDDGRLADILGTEALAAITPCNGAE